MRNEDVAEGCRDFFIMSGAYVLTDGQYGSTGKGVIAAALAETFSNKVDMVLSNAGPNSGHTSYFNGEKIVLKQLPTFAVIADKMAQSRGTTLAGEAIVSEPIHKVPNILLTGGAVVDPTILINEIQTHLMHAITTVHPYAAVIDMGMKDEDAANVKAMASTGQGVGPALIRKMHRPAAGAVHDRPTVEKLTDWRSSVRQAMYATMFMEVSQGYSLGINSGFYPHVTTRECTVSQALSDAGLPPSMFRQSILSVRTFPIRVGSTENSSGPCYPDQMETDWSKLGVEPELTTVTKRVRRVFTWSDLQFMEAVFANDPSVIFCNFVQYLKPEDQKSFVWDHVVQPYTRVKGKLPKAILLGYGPTTEDIKLYRY